MCLSVCLRLVRHKVLEKVNACALLDVRFPVVGCYLEKDVVAEFQLRSLTVIFGSLVLEGN